MKIFIVIPTYCERENITPLVKEIFSINLNHTQVAIIDDNSPDGTGGVAEALKNKYSPNIFVIHRTQKLGLGSAYVVGFKKALSEGADFIITLDADFSHQPRYLPDLINMAKKNDVSIGSRYIKGGKIKGWTYYRKFLSWGANKFSRVILGLKTEDNTTGFRCYRKEVLEKLPLEKIKSEGYSFLIEMSYYFKKYGIKVREVPIVFENRTRGSSKISRKEIFKALTLVLKLPFRK